MLWLLPALALASPVEPLRPAGGLVRDRGTLTLDSPQLGEAGFGAAVWGSYVQRPVPGLAEAAAPVDLQLQYTFDQLRIDVNATAMPWVDLTTVDTTGPAWGDVTIGALVPVWTDASDALSAGLQIDLGIPTGWADGLSTRGAHGRLAGLVGGDVGARGSWTTQLAFTAADAIVVDRTAFGSQVELGAGLAGRPTDWLRLGIEARGGYGLPGGGGRANPRVDAGGFASFRLPAGFAVHLGASSGFGVGVGGARVRAHGGLSWAFTPRTQPIARTDLPCAPGDADCLDQVLVRSAPSDRDDDGYRDEVDACPDAPEDYDGRNDQDGCPDTDDDGDGVPDVLDECPIHPGPEATRGCPDYDGDGIADNRDLCPATPASTRPDGCTDLDLDGVSDALDDCPEQAGPVERGGCGGGVWRQGHRVLFDGTLAFRSGSDRLDPRTRALLDALGDWLRTHPHIGPIEVGGHTDGEGDRDANLALSVRRAESVVRALTARGVSPERLVARGYGPDAPIDTNRTGTGRERNRRISLVLLRGLDRPPIHPDDAALLERGLSW